MSTGSETKPLYERVTKVCYPYRQSPVQVTRPDGVYAASLPGMDGQNTEIIMDSLNVCSSSQLLEQSKQPPGSGGFVRLSRFVTLRILLVGFL